MSAKQILRHHVPALKNFFAVSARRSYGEFYKHKHIVTSFKVYNRPLRLHEPTVSRLSNVSLQTVNTECSRRFSYSCRCVSSHSNVDFSSDALKKHDGDDAVKQTQIADPQLASLIKDIHEDFEDESRKLHSEATAGEEQKHKVSDRSQIERNLNAVDVNKKDIGFEYDYQVAEDIEEYDYIDENNILEQQVRPEKVLPISLKSEF